MPAVVIMPQAIMRADITVAARFMGGGECMSAAAGFMAGARLWQAAEALPGGVTLDALAV
jgi:hypothetical protein